MSYISFTVESSVGYVTINRPPHNFFKPSMIRDVVDAFLHIESKYPECVAIVLSANGQNFCAGMDMGAVDGEAERAAFAEAVYGEASRLFDITVPLIAVVQGAAVGGGMGLACACDYRVADQATRFVANFTRLGIHPGFALSSRLSQLIGEARAKDILMRSKTLSGAEAETLGLVDELVDGDFGQGVEQILSSLRGLAPLAVRAVKRTMNARALGNTHTTMGHELSEQTRLWATSDAAEGISSLREHRTPYFLGQ